MSKSLVLVESPAKAKTINKYLGKNFVVEATVGHIKNLPKTRLGVKIEENFLPEFVTIRGKGDTIKKIKGLAVKSVALKLICDRESEIDKFKAIEYWSIWAIFKIESNEFVKAKLFSIAGKVIKVPHKFDMSVDEWNEFNEKSFTISSEIVAQQYFDTISKINQFTISNIIRRHTKRTAPAPFITSTLQAEASRRLRMRPKQTMMLAQKLYEGVELGKEGPAGLITYMRTDSTRISEEILPKVREYIKHKFGNEYLPDSPIIYYRKNKANVQDAHEAIRPTSLEYTPEFVKK